MTDATLCRLVWGGLFAFTVAFWSAVVWFVVEWF